MTTPARKLTTRYRPVRGISVNEIVEMHRVFSGLHRDTDLPTFLRDLQTNDGAIIVRDRETGAICGFTTIKRIPLLDGERQALGIFSGDAVLDPTCRGDRALQDALTRHLLYLWLTSRGVPLYWLLLSKSFKTYLLLANTFVHYHPRPDGQIDPRLQRLTQQYTDRLFPGRYDEARGVLDAGQGGQPLRHELQATTATRRLQNPVVNCFALSSPGWRIGHQLPCIGRISLSLLKPYLIKEKLKIQGRRKSAERSRPSVEALVAAAIP